MDSESNPTDNRKTSSDDMNINDKSGIRDYIYMFRGETHAYYLTEYSIIEASFRSRASALGVSQVPLFGRAINNKLSQRSAQQNLANATIESLRRDGKIVKEIRWDDVEKASLNGRKLHVTGSLDTIRITFLKKWENTYTHKIILYAFSAYLGEKFTTTHTIPPNAKESLEAMLDKLRKEGNYMTPSEMMTSVDKKVSNSVPKSEIPAESVSDEKPSRTNEQNMSTNTKQNESISSPVENAAKGGDPYESRAKGNTAGRSTEKRYFNNNIKRLVALLIVIIVVVSVVVIVYNLPSTGSVKEPYITYGSHVYNSDTSLTANVFAGNITIEAGVTVFTNGYNFFVTGKFVNEGIIITGHKYLTQNLPYSYGGSGGGGGYSYTTNAIGVGGYSTRYPGGAGGEIGADGFSASPFNISVSELYTWYNSSAVSAFPNGLSQYLAGASGGLSGNLNNKGASKPGEGAYGIVIQASTIFAGTIYANGTGSEGGGAGSGGGGGGVILLLYGTGGLINGTYDVSGGSGLSPGVSYADNYGGNGGNGNVIASFFTGSFQKR